MTEEYQDCPKCGAGNPEGKKFCGDCGYSISGTVPSLAARSPRPGRTRGMAEWMAANWKGSVALVVILVVVLATIGLIYTQPWSKVRVTLYNEDRYYSLEIAISIDGEIVMSGKILPREGGVMGAYDVQPGSHLVSVDGYWTHSGYTNPDFTFHWSNTFGVGPLYTKDVFVYPGST